MTRRARAAIAASLVAITAGAWSAGPTHKPTGTPAPAPRASAAAASASASAAASAPVEFAGTFATGTTYVGDMFYDARALKTWRPVKDVQPGANVAWTVRWDNIDQFPALKTAAGQARTQRFRFRVGIAEDAVDGDVPLRGPQRRAGRSAIGTDADTASAAGEAPTLTGGHRRSAKIRR